MHHLKKHKSYRKIKWNEDCHTLPSTALELISMGISTKSKLSLDLPMKQSFVNGFACPKCGKVFPFLNGLRMHYDQCVKNDQLKEENFEKGQGQHLNLKRDFVYIKYSHAVKVRCRGRSYFAVKNFFFGNFDSK